MNDTDIYERLKKNIKKGTVRKNADMGEYTSFRTGGRASLLIIPADREELKISLNLLSETGTDNIVTGNGSNILVKDGGYRGAVIKLGEAFDSITVRDRIIEAGCGALLSQVAREAARHGLAGMEFASGIPGSTGGAVFMNAGAYGGEMKDIVEKAEVISGDGSSEYTLPADQMDMGYRHSIFCETKDVAVNVFIRLEKGDPGTIQEKIRELTARRNSRQPVNLPSAGSFFKRPEGYFAGKLIEDSGLKGISVGGAQVSPVHAGFIVNNGGASASDIIQLMHIIQAAVMDDHGVMLEPEVRIIGEDA